MRQEAERETGQQRREREAREDEELLGAERASWGVAPPDRKSVRAFIWADRLSEAAGWASAIGIGALAIASPWQGAHLLWQAPLAIGLIKATRLCSRMALLGGLAGGAMEGAKSGALMAARLAQATAVFFAMLPILIVCALRQPLDPERARAMEGRLRRISKGLGFADAIAWALGDAELAMAKRLGPAFAWSVAAQWRGDKASEWFLWDLWRAAPFDPSWPVSPRWVGSLEWEPPKNPVALALKEALAFVFGPSLRRWGSSKGAQEGATLMSLAERSRSREGPPSRDILAPDPQALAAALERERVARAMSDPGARGKRRFGGVL